MRRHSIEGSGARRQRGVVLFISLIVLVAMTLAAIAAVRSVESATAVAGNLSFKQSTTLGGDAAIEAARNWILTKTTAGALFASDTANGYLAFAETSGAGVETDWTSYATSGTTPWSDTTKYKELTTADAAGNTIKYVIQRMCSTTGDPNATSSPPNCMSSVVEVASQGSGMGAGRTSVTGINVYYYRVTARITGPRNTISYVQAMIEL